MIAPPGQEGWREAPGWWFKIQIAAPVENLSMELSIHTDVPGLLESNRNMWCWIHHPVCAFGAATPPGQAYRYP